jgi:hypothetical protein
MADCINNFGNKYQILNSLYSCDILSSESRNEDHSDLTRATCNGHALCFVWLEYFLGVYHQTMMLLLRWKISQVKLYYDRRSVAQSVLLSSTHLKN